MNIDFSMPDIDLSNFDTSTTSNKKSDRIESKYIKPKSWKGFKERQIKYENAAKLSKEIIVTKDERAFVIIDGKFIFGDFIEVFITDRDLHIKELNISTLSFSQENIDSLENLMYGGFVDKLNIIISDYFYSHERHSLIEYAYYKLDVDNRFQLSVARHHTKIACFETHCNKKFVLHGSANLRSSDNIEQLVVEQSFNLYDFNKDWMDKIKEKYYTINQGIELKPKSLRGKNLWNAIQ